MKVKLDENVTAAATSLFIQQDHDCDTVAEEDLTGAPDATLMARCRSENRLLVTFDVGFGDIRVYPPSGHHGVVLLRLHDQQPSAVLEALGKLLDRHDVADLTSRLTVVTDDRVRFRE